MLERSGKPETINLAVRFKKVPFKVGDSFALTLRLNNGIQKRIKTKVT